MHNEPVIPRNNSTTDVKGAGAEADSRQARNIPDYSINRVLHRYTGLPYQPAIR
ncbi:hypothetical protein E8E13_010319 [Curvularia kusanoi]|uniref:Uncharacterized protein n=1 Tax=Curvularia kusanoi TaxID=90978 RepID=A0A9P4TI54_CURKU|nr:hypothetical protein E8E13_010319 [Curvularia kusanoi]